MVLCIYRVMILECQRIHTLYFFAKSRGDNENGGAEIVRISEKTGVVREIKVRRMPFHYFWHCWPRLGLERRAFDRFET